MPSETWTFPCELFQAFNEAGFAIVVSQHKMKVAVSIFRMKVVEPLDGHVQRMFQRRVRAPFEIEDVTPQNQRMGTPHLRPQFGHQIVRTRASRKKM